MTRATCARLFEAEAMRDGRLAGDQLASFARHTTGCAVCRREVRALEELADRLRADAAGGAATNELRGLRERTRLIAAFDGALVSPPGRTPRWRWAGTAAVAVIAVAAAVVLRGRAPDAGKKAAAPAVVVQAGAATVWTKSVDRNRDRIVLERGDLWIRVDHARQKAGLVVALPDGELEDTGTTFTVSVAEGHTRAVAVQEGSVILRLAGRAAVTIGGGETWRAAAPQTATPPPAAVVAADAALAEPQLPGPMQGSMRGLMHGAAAGSPPQRARSMERGTARVAGEADPAGDFRAAVGALDAGASREAAAAFTRFLAEHARDPRAEDAAYLRVVALQRCAATEETRRAARTYLQLFPRGFRRTEIEPLAR